MITVIHNYTRLQEKSKSKYGHAERLQILRLKKQLSWEQLAELLGLSVAMLYHVKRGVRNLSEKAVYRLEQAEVTAGLRPPAASETSSFKARKFRFGDWAKATTYQIERLGSQNAETFAGEFPANSGCAKKSFE